MKDKKKTLLVLGALLSVIVITVGVSFAFFNYAKLGSTENSITSGTITFLYTEVDKVGAGIKLENAIPITDTAGKMLTGSGNVFNFKVTSTTNINAAIPYEVTARMKEGSDLDPNVVKVYLTKGETEEEVLLDKYSNLTQTSRVSEDVAVEKTIYTGKVPSNTDNYEETFKLRMWIDSETDYSPVEKDGEIIYPYNNKTFTLMVNVYADAKVVTQEDKKAEITNLIVGGVEATELTGKDYNYEVTLPEGTTKTIINVETVSEYATVEVEKIDSVAYSSNVKKLGVSKVLELTPGNNYFKIIVTNEDSEIENSYKLKIYVTTYMDSSNLLSIGDAVTAVDGSKWHVLEASASGTSTVVLLSDYNLNSDGSYNTTCGININNTDVCSPIAFDSGNNNTYNENNSNNIGYFIKNTYERLVKTALPGTINVTIPTADQIAIADNKTFTTNTMIENSWLLTTSYWTKTSSITNYTWYVTSYHSAIHHYYANTATWNGARPVIVTPKTNLLAE